MALLLLHLGISDEQGLALHHHLHLAQVVADERRAATDNVEDGIGQAYARADFHAAGNDVYLGMDMMVVEELLKNDGIGCGYLLTFEPL